MFIFDIDQPQVVYTAEDLGSGVISRLDLRTNISEKIFTTSAPPSSRRIVKNSLLTMHGMKAVAQSAVLGGSQMLVGGKGFVFGLLDLRCLGPIFEEGDDYESSNESSKFVKTWSPHYGSSQSSDRLIFSNKIGKKSDVSISGLTFSGDGRSILASYQGDQVYIFDVAGKECNAAYGGVSGCRGIMKSEDQKTSQSIENLEDSSSTEKIGARNMLGGHINYATFLKSVAFFGPRDEYVVSGSDSGHLWIWDARSVVYVC